ncbi:MAG: PadR family transcriptional regulator [Solirubrobacterales bacterium]
MELSATAKVILGMLAMHPRSGYEIKAFADHSTRFFWTASYGQIYPELRRLTDAGLISGKASPRGGRQRTVYELTRAGRRALEGWHELPAEIFEYRDEGLLKLFFSDAVAPEHAAEIARQLAERAVETGDELRAVEEQAEGKNPGAYTVLRFGIAFNDFIADWFERQAAAFEEGVPLGKPEGSPDQEGRV